MPAMSILALQKSTWSSFQKLVGCQWRNPCRFFGAQARCRSTCKRWRCCKITCMVLVVLLVLLGIVVGGCRAGLDEPEHPIGELVSQGYLFSMHLSLVWSYTCHDSAIKVAVHMHRYRLDATDSTWHHLPWFSHRWWQASTSLNDQGYWSQCYSS